MDKDGFASRAVGYELSENIGRNKSEEPTLGDIIARRFHRRDVLKGALATSVIASTVSPLALAAASASEKQAGSEFSFTEVSAGVDQKDYVAPGYKADKFLRWGDPLYPGAPEFDPYSQTDEKQSRQFGYNNDFIGFLPINGSSEHGLLVVNHEYTNEELMFPDVGVQHTKKAAFKMMGPDLVKIEMAAHGGSVVEIKKKDGVWGLVANSKYTRRITALTQMEIVGPAAGHQRMQTSKDPDGRNVVGMINNCAGGVTPWGTWLSCEENFHGYFSGKLPESHPESENHKRYGVPGKWQNWHSVDERFDVGEEPKEANRFGWVVEIDPFNPDERPKKRTALGRFKHEGAGSVVNKDGRYVIYQGDDEVFEYVYKFVTASRFEPDNPTANRDLLDAGTLYAARFNDDMTGEWLPLVHGEGPLTKENGFASQADVLIGARLSASALDATPMDRPEDVEVSPVTGKAYVMLTKNSVRTREKIDKANPRAKNSFGHIVEITPDNGDHAAKTFTWDILVRCGDPDVQDIGATFSAATSRDGWFANPDNCVFDNLGRLWIATDGNSTRKTGRTDGLWAMETQGERRATSRLFYRCPIGAELCGPCFTPDGKTLFVAVQHPGAAESRKNPSTFEDPLTRWPDFKLGMPPRPSVVVITKEDGGQIG